MKLEITFIIYEHCAKINKDITMREVNSLRYFWTLFWTFLLMQMLTYVVSSMTGAAFDFQTGLILTVAATILIFVISAIIPNEPNGHEGTH